MATPDPQDSASSPRIDPSSVDDEIRLPDSLPDTAFAQPPTIGCVFAGATLRIGAISPAAYAELIEEL